jgi:hypothetical protein
MIDALEIRVRESLESLEDPIIASGHCNFSVWEDLEVSQQSVSQYSDR